MESKESQEYNEAAETNVEYSEELMLEMAALLESEIKPMKRFEALAK